MSTVEPAESRILRRIRQLAWALIAEAVLVAAVVGLALIFANGADRWLLLAPGVIGVAILGFSGVTVGKRKVEGLPSHPLLVSISVVNFIFFGWYTGQVIAQVLGNSAGVGALIEKSIFALVFGVAIVITYRELGRIRLELMSDGHRTQQQESPRGDL